MTRVDHRARAGSYARSLLAARIGTQLLAALFTIVVARRLGASGLGEYAFVAAVVFLANVVTTFGTDMLLMRELAARRDTSRLGSALALQLALSVPLIAVAFTAGGALPNQPPEVGNALRIYSLALVPLAAYSVFTSALRGLGLMEAYALLNLAVAGAQLVAGLLFVPQGATIVTVVSVLLLIQLLAAALGAVLCTRQIPDFWISVRSPPLRIAPLARESAPIATLGVLGILYQRSALYLLPTLANAGATGVFSAAQRLVESSKVVHTATLGALYPAFAQEGADAQASGWLAGTRGRPLRALLALATVVALALTVLADPLVPFLYGPGFDLTIDALRVLAWVLVPYTVSAYLSLALVAAQRERPVARALFASFVVLVLLCAWWIPVGGAIGACWATLAAETLLAMMLVIEHGLPSLS